MTRLLERLRRWLQGGLPAAGRERDRGTPRTSPGPSPTGKRLRDVWSKIGKRG